MFVWFDGFWILSAWTSTVDHQLFCFRMIHQIIWSYDSMIRLWLMLIHNRLMLLLWQVPTGPELYDMYSSKWSRLLPAREQDLLYMHLWVSLDKVKTLESRIYRQKTSLTSQDFTGLDWTSQDCTELTELWTACSAKTPLTSFHWNADFGWWIFVWYRFDPESWLVMVHQRWQWEQDCQCHRH